MLLQNLSEKDYLVLRGPFVSKRQSPKSLGANLVLLIILQAFLLCLEYFINGFSKISITSTIIQIHLIYSCLLGGIGLIFALSLVYMRAQRLQYLISILVTQNLGSITFFIFALLTIASEMSYNPQLFLNFTSITILIGVLIFTITSFRFLYLLKKGNYRKGGAKDQQRMKWESKSLLPIVLPIGLGITFIIQFIMRNFELLGLDSLFLIMICLFLVYIMIFILPEQLVILYCKFRFDSFNFDKNGRLNPVRDEKGNRIPEEKLEAYFRHRTTDRLE